MQLFILNEEPTLAAADHSDVHTIKQVLETTQLLCNAHHTKGFIKPPYGLTHVKHPCSIWIAESYENYMWAVALGKALAKEYTLRYKKTHKCEPIIDWLSVNIPNLEAKGLTPFAVAIKPEIKEKVFVPNNPVQTYRNYYHTKRGGRHATWITRKPNWWNEELTF